MPDQNPASSSSSRSLTPEDIANRVFPTARRGLAPEAVNQFLGEVAQYVRELRNEVRSAALHQRPTPAPAPAPQPPQALDEAALTRALGEETVRVLKTARESAHVIVNAAEHQAAELITGAEALVQSRREDVEAFSRTVRDRAERERAELIEKTKVECRSMIEEAREARRRVLVDLGDRRRILLTQLEQVRVGKETLAEAIDAVSLGVVRSLDEVRVQLSSSEERAKIAAEHAAKELDSRLLAGVEEVDALVEEALARLPRSVSENVLAAMDEEGSPASEPRVFDIEREPNVRTSIALSGPTVVSPELTVTGPIVGTETRRLGAEGGEVSRTPERVPDTTATVSQVGLVTPVVSSPIAKNNDALIATAVTPPEAASTAPESPVDQLFAKIRASRASKTADAQRVLAGGPSESETKSVDSSLDEASDVVIDASTAKPATNADTAPSRGKVASSDVVEVPNSEGDPVVGEDRMRSRRDELLAPPSQELSRALKRALREEQNLLLDALRHLKKGERAITLLPSEETRLRLTGEITAPILDAYLAATVFLALANKRGRRNAPDGTHALGIARRLADEILDGIHTRLESAFTTERDGTEECAEAVGAAFRDWKAARIEGLAGDYITAAFGEGCVAAASAKKIALSWQLDDPSNCPDCDDNSVAGPVPAGSAFPTGHLFPPVHPGCRCYLTS